MKERLGPHMTKDHPTRNRSGGGVEREKSVPFLHTNLQRTLPVLFRVNVSSEDYCPSSKMRLISYISQFSKTHINFMAHMMCEGNLR